MQLRLICAGQIPIDRARSQSILIQWIDRSHPGSIDRLVDPFLHGFAEHISIDRDKKGVDLHHADRPIHFWIDRSRGRSRAVCAQENRISRFYSSLNRFCLGIFGKNVLNPICCRGWVFFSVRFIFTLDCFWLLEIVSSREKKSILLIEKLFLNPIWFHVSIQWINLLFSVFFIPCLSNPTVRLGWIEGIHESLRLTC